MAIERIVDTSTQDDPVEVELEVTLRPRTFAEYVGQERLKSNLQLAISAAKKRGEPVDHVLLYGPPGLGKTTMASVIANEMGLGRGVDRQPTCLQHRAQKGTGGALAVRTGDMEHRRQAKLRIA